MINYGAASEVKMLKQLSLCQLCDGMPFIRNECPLFSKEDGDTNKCKQKVYTNAADLFLYRKKEGYEINDDQDLDTVIFEVLKDLGTPSHLAGYGYLCEAIKITVKNRNVINSMGRVLYPTLAERFETVPTRVERNIRHAVEVTWDYGNLDTLERYFGYTISARKGKPTNSEFISLIASYIRCYYNN